MSNKLVFRSTYTGQNVEPTVRFIDGWCFLMFYAGGDYQVVYV